MEREQNLESSVAIDYPKQKRMPLAQTDGIFDFSGERVSRFDVRICALAHSEVPSLLI